MKAKMSADESGQALVELSLGLVMLCVFVFGIIDFGRAIYDVQVMKNLVGEGSSLASRQTTSPSQAVSIVIADAGNDLHMSTSGCVIISQVSNLGAGTPQVVAQATGGGLTGASCKSKVGCVSGTTGCSTGNASIPQAAINALTTEGTGSSVFATEFYYSFTTITPLPAWLGNNVLPSDLYSVAYY